MHFQVPESPNWLLAKNRPKDALKSLQWLRGWVSSSSTAVNEEFSRLQNFSETANACKSCEKQSIRCEHMKITFGDKIKQFKRKRNLKPFILVILLDFFMEFSALGAWRGFMIQIIKAYGMPMKANVTTVVSSVINAAANVCFILSVKRIGKRKIYLCSAFIYVICFFGLSTNFQMISIFFRFVRNLFEFFVFF